MSPLPRIARITSCSTFGGASVLRHQCDPIYRGFHVPYSRLEYFLEHNLVVEADKDS